jgi:hypothetical protein
VEERNGVMEDRKKDGKIANMTEVEKGEGL